ncbi:MAG: DUF1800 family protein [Lysobacterales bacterium]
MFLAQLRVLTALTAMTALLLPIGVSAQCSGDCIMNDQFENAFWRAESDAEAARFMNQATFGANRSGLSTVRALGFQQWIEQQFVVPQTLARPFLEQVARVRHDANRTIDQTDRLHRWYDTAVTANDQLRQKMAYALGQIIVVSDQNDNLSGQPLQMAEWNDILVRNAFGNYRDLLREASFSPMMGRYLTHLRNRRYELDPTFTTQAGTPTTYTITNYVAANSGNEPDENYAREVMQLFSIGLEGRNRDFSLIDLEPGTPGIQGQNTYDQEMIRTLSRAFTGLAFACNPTEVVQGITVQQNCSGTRNSAPPATPPCAGAQCRFTNRSNLFFQDPPRASLPNGNTSSLRHGDWYRPMVCYPHFNDNGRDVDRFQLPGQGGANPVNTIIQGGVLIPAGAPDKDKSLVLSGTLLETQAEFQAGVSKETVVNCNSNESGGSNPVLTASERNQCINYCEDNVRSAVDLLFFHPNTPPMVARQLIQRFVNSNPSPEFVDRVAAVFENNGSGVRGDLKATIMAVLLDEESRRPFSGQFGKPREPFLRMIAVWRNFGYQSGGNTCRDSGGSSSGNGAIACWGTGSPQNVFFQRPLGAPSVFNFYEPDFQPPGVIADAGLFAPEFQIINENSTMLTANEMMRAICENYGSDNCNNNLTTPPTDRAFLNPSVLDTLPGMACALDVVNGCNGSHDRDLIEELNLRMMGGMMTGAIGNPNLCNDPLNSGMKSVLHNLLGCGLVGNLGQTGATAGRDARRRKALYLVHLIAISPEYAHQR